MTMFVTLTICCGRPPAACRCHPRPINNHFDPDILLPPSEPLVPNAADPVDHHPDAPLVPPTIDYDQGAGERDRERYRRLLGDGADDLNILLLPPPTMMWCWPRRGRTTG